MNFYRKFINRSCLGRLTSVFLVNIRYLKPMLFLCLMVSCRTVPEKLPAESSAKSVKKRLELNSEFSGCIGDKPRCTSEKAPEYCHATVITSKSRSLEFYAWGQNRCKARSKINMQFCSQGIVGTQKGWMDCKPDATNGRCPPEENTSCMEIMAPTTCFAGYYGKQRISSDLSMLAKGQNECEAKENLKILACTKNLDPTKLRYISCELDKIEDISFRH